MEGRVSLGPQFEDTVLKAGKAGVEAVVTSHAH